MRFFINDLIAGLTVGFVRLPQDILTQLLKKNLEITYYIIPADFYTVDVFNLRLH